MCGDDPKPSLAAEPPDVWAAILFLARYDVETGLVD
jgi:hypothetical protein